MRLRLLIPIVAALCAGAAGLAVVLGGDGPDGNRDLPAQDPAHEEGGEAAAPAPRPPEEVADEPDSALAVHAASDYIAAINSRNGGAVCTLLAPEARRIVLPVRRGRCGPSIAASLGHADPRGYPVWERTEVLGYLSADELRDGLYRITATVRHSFADRETISHEDDPIYVVRRGGRWLVAQPSTTLYRAIGVPDVPPRALAPPR